MRKPRTLIVMRAAPHKNQMRPAVFAAEFSFDQTVAQNGKPTSAARPHPRRGAAGWMSAIPQTIRSRSRNTRRSPEAVRTGEASPI